MRDGMPSMAVRAVFRDSRGLMWMGTDAGLCTFDGKSFRILKPSEGMTASRIWSIAEDESGHMWFGSHGEGVFRYDGRHFTRFTVSDGLIDDRVRVLLYSKNFRCLIAGSPGGISIIRGDKITRFPEEPSGTLQMNVVTSLADAGKFIYITTYDHFSPVRYYPDKNIAYSVHDDGIRYPKCSFSCHITSKGDTLFSLEDNGVCILKKEGTVQNDSLGQVFGIAEDRRGDLWFASWSTHNMNSMGGIWKFDGKTFQNYKAAFGISDREIWTVSYDRTQDILWVGTLNEGLFMVPFTAMATFPASWFNPEQRKINTVYLDSENKLWISGSRELVRMDEDGRITFMDKHAMIMAYRRYWNEGIHNFSYQMDTLRRAARNLNGSQLTDFVNRTEFNFMNVIDDTEHSFLFLNEFGLYRYDRQNGKMVFLAPETVTNEIAVMGDTMISSCKEFTCYLPEYKTGRFFRDNPLTFPFSIPSSPKNVNRLIKHANRFWYASGSSGLWMSQRTNLLHFNETDSTISNSLNDICFDTAGHVIFGSNTGEIEIATCYGNKLKIDYRVSDKEGLQGNSVSWIVADGNGKLWAGTNRGLNCIDLDSLYLKQKYVIRFMDEEEGYNGQTSKRAVIDKKGNLWIAAADQLIRYETGKLLDSQVQPGNVILTSIEINNTLADSLLKPGTDAWTSLDGTELVFNHSQKNMVFYYDILNYVNPGKDRFRYRLSGYEREWHPWSTSRRAVFTNLRPGLYTLSVESTNLFTLAEAKPLEITFRIRNPWWGLWYLQLLSGLLITGSAIFVLHAYFRRERKKQQQKSEIGKKIARLEMQALQAQMNPHFIFNCVSGIQYYVLANKMDEVLGYLSDFSKVVGESLANATLRVVPLEQEISFLRSYLRLEQMRFPGKFEYIIRGIEEKDSTIIQIPPMLVQPFAENSIRHGFMKMEKTGNLSIVFAKAGKDVLKCTVTDNGIGRVKSREPEESPGKNDRPHSAAITEARIRLFNTPDAPGKYKIVYTDLTENGQPAGLKVELFLPFEKAGNR